MASALYLENFLESIENLPQELRRNFALMRDLDQRTEDMKADIDRTSKHYRSNVSRINKEDKLSELNKVHEMFKKAVENSDNKVQIAMQMYEMVDKYIRKLDAELSRFEQELQLKDSLARRTSLSSLSDIQAAAKPRGRKRSGGPGADEARGGVGGALGPPGTGSSRKRKASSTAGEDIIRSGSIASPPVAMAAGPSTDVMDMPVDPNEPTYCLCHQVSFGEMIGCDNVDCPIEWFHFQCVGLTAKPKGKWYCPKCSQDRDKRKKYC